MRIERRLVDASGLLAELDRPQPEHQAIAAKIANAIDPLLTLLVGVSGPSRNSAPLTFGICNMLARGVTDVLTATHLASHFLAAQSYGVMRPIFEALDLLDLFAQDPEEAVKWATTDKAFREF